MEEHETLSAKIAAYISERAKPKVEDLAKKAEKERKKAADSPETLAALEADLADEELALKLKFEPAAWLTDAARRAGQIAFATHPIKFTNSQAKGASSHYAEPGPQQPEGMPDGSLISTTSLARPVIDVDGNAAALDVAALLQLEQDGRMLLHCIQKRDAEPLRPFAANEEQLAGWMEGFAQVLAAAAPSSHTLAKQLYFPAGGRQYHLLSPLFSSSLAQAVHERIQQSRFYDEAKEVRKARREEKFHESLAVDYPDTAVMSFGGTKPQNVSQLNSRRGGKVYLLSCAPPVWKRRATPPLGTKTVFSRHHFGAYAHQETYLLNKFLEWKKPERNTKKIRDRRAELIDRIIDQLIQYAAEIQDSFAEGWSKDSKCKLRQAEQLWLDPRRGKDDEVFALEREKKEWVIIIVDYFASWLNRRIEKGEGRQILFTSDVEHREWEGELHSDYDWKKQLKEKERQLEKELEAFA